MPNAGQKVASAKPTSTTTIKASSEAQKPLINMGFGLMPLTCPQNWSSLKVSLRGFLDIGKFLRVVGFRSRWAIAQRAVGPDRVVLTTPLLDEYLSFP